MDDFETELSDLSYNFEEKSIHFSQTGGLDDPSLNQLRDQIKNVMIPLLIKTFQFKLELNQSLSLPSRLQNQKNQRPPEEIIEHLKTLDHDLKILLLWCQSCRNQIHKALNTPDKEQKNILTASVPPTSNIAVSKSFNEAVSTFSSFCHSQANEEKKDTFSGPSTVHSPKTWWRKLTGK